MARNTEAPAAPPLARPTAPAVPRIDGATYERLAGRVRLLSWVSLVYMALEGGLAISPASSRVPSR